LGGLDERERAIRRHLEVDTEQEVLELTLLCGGERPFEHSLDHLDGVGEPVELLERRDRTARRRGAAAVLGRELEAARGSRRLAALEADAAELERQLGSHRAVGDRALDLALEAI